MASSLELSKVIGSEVLAFRRGFRNQYLVHLALVLQCRNLLTVSGKLCIGVAPGLGEHGERSGGFRYIILLQRGLNALRLFFLLVMLLRNMEMRREHALAFRRERMCFMECLIGCFCVRYPSLCNCTLNYLGALFERDAGEMVSRKHYSAVRQRRGSTEKSQAR